MPLLVSNNRLPISGYRLSNYPIQHLFRNAARESFNIASAVAQAEKPLHKTQRLTDCTVEILQTQQRIFEDLRVGANLPALLIQGRTKDWRLGRLSTHVSP